MTFEIVAGWNLEHETIDAEHRLRLGTSNGEVVIEDDASERAPHTWHAAEAMLYLLELDGKTSHVMSNKPARSP